MYSANQMKKVLEEFTITTDCSICADSALIMLTGRTITALPDGDDGGGYFTDALLIFIVDEDNALESIGSFTFYMRNEMTSFAIYNSSDLKTIGQYAF